MGIEIKQEQHESTRIIALSGRLDTETSADVELALQDLLAAGERNFLIDMAGIGYVSSAGLRVLLATAKKLEGDKGSLRLCGLNASVKQVFDVAGFSKLFAIFPMRELALGAAARNKKDAAKKIEAAKPEPPKVESPKQEALLPHVVLAQKIMALLGIKQIDEPPRPEVVELSRVTALLLGAAPMAAGAKMPSQAASKSKKSPEVAAAASRDPAAPGVMGKLRGLFGGKK